MTDLFAQQGITYSSASMASTHPSATPEPIEAPHIDMNNVPANAAPAAAQPAAQDSGNASPDERDYLTQLTDPQPTSKSLAGAGSEGSAAPGAAPPQAPASSGVDLFQQEGVKAPPVSEVNANAFNQGVEIPPANADGAPQQVPELTIGNAGNANRGIAPTSNPVAYAQNQQAQDAKIGQAVFTQQELDGFKNNPIGFAEAFGKVNRYGYVLGDNDAQALKIAPLALKLNAGQALTPEENATMTQYLRDTTEINLRGFTWGGKTAYVGAQMPSWAAQFMASGGLGKAVEVGAERAAVAGAEKLISGAVVRYAAQGSMLMAAHYEPHYAEQQLNDISAVTDKGQLLLRESEHSPAQTAALAFGHTAADVIPQMLAPAIGKYAVQPAKAMLATPIVNAASKLSPETTTALYNAWKAVNPSASVSRMFTSMGWSGMVEQLGANRVQQVLNASVDFAGNKNETFDDYLHAMTPDKDQLLLEGGLISIAGGVHASTSLTVNLLRGKGVPLAQATETAANMSSLEKDQFVNTNLPLPVSKTPSIDEVKPSSRAADLPENERKEVVSNYQNRLDSVNGVDTGMKKPLVNMLKAKGGIDPGSDIAQELQNMGITSRTAPGLYKKGGTAGELDNIPATEFNAKYGVTAPEDGNGYVDRNWLIDQVREEIAGRRIGGGHASDDDFAKLLDNYGIDPRKASGEEVYRLLGPFPEAKLVAQNMGEILTNKDAVELQKQMAGRDIDLETAVEQFYERQAMVVHGDSTSISAAKNIIRGGTREANKANPAPINEDESGFNVVFRSKAAKVYSEMWNDLQPLENLGDKARVAGAPIKDSELSAAALSLAKSTPALIERQWTTGTTSWDMEGNQVETGKGLKQIGDDYDNMFAKLEPNRDQRQQDMIDFRKAMTFIEDQTKGHNPVSEKDFAEAQVNLARLTDKYGEQMKWMETFAKEYRDWDNRILHNLVTSGLKTQAWYDDLVGKREWYSSTARVTETEYPEDVAAMRGKSLGKDVNPKNIGALKQRKGSEKEVINPVLSSMRNSAIIIQRAMLNKVRRDVAKYARYYPEEVQVKPPALIREAVEHSYDPKLRTKLEQIAEFMGGQVKRAQAGEKLPQLKGNLGAYEPATRTTYLKPGTTEGTLTHEIGHQLDYLYGLKEKFLGSKTMKAELEKLAENRLRSDISLERTPEGKTEFAEEFDVNPKKYVDYVKSPEEVMANFFDAWVNSPEQVERVAPTAKALFEKFIDNNPDLAALKQIEPSTQRAMETIQKALLDFKGPKDSLPFYDKGRLKFLHMSPEISEAFKGLDQVQGTLTGNFIAKIGKAQARMLQFGATNNPYFIVRHFLRGAQSSYVNTPEGGARGFMRHFAVEIPKGIAAVIGKNDAYREWASNSGALRTYMDTSNEGIAKLHADMFEHADMKEFLNPLNWARLAKDGFVKGWTTAKQVSDYAPRIAAYERLKEKGYSDLEAGFLSLEATGNYIRHGSLGKQINAYSPFFNDRLQGADRFLRAIKRDPAGYSLRAIALITMPQLLISGYYLFAADDETRKEYLNLSDFRRNTAMNVKIGGQWIPLPRAFAPGFVFGALPEHAMIHFSGIAHPELKNFWLHLIGDTVNSLSPSTDWTQTIPPLIKSAIEATANFSFYRDMPIFHGDINKTAPENRFNSNTSETAKALGKLFGISPANIDNTAYDMAAHIGVYATQLGDAAINTQRRLTGQPVNERPSKASDNPLYGPLMQPAPIGTASESYQEFHEHAQDLQQQHNRDKELTGKDKADFEHENHQDIALYPTINRANTEVMHENHEIRLITENPHFTGDQKAQMIAQRQQRIEAIVEGANNVYRQAKGQKQ